MRCGAPLEIHIDEDQSAYTTPVAPGTIFEGKYQVLDEIGRGGMGVVYRGHDLSLDRLVAIKVLPEQFNTDDEVIARFKREARAMAHLDHPNIVPVYAIGQQRSFHYFVMKFLDGETVAERLDVLRESTNPHMAPEIVRKVVVEVCKGLAHAHGRGLIHRDIKPGNIMLGPSGHVTLMDFGIVKEQAGEDTLTRTGLVFGTPEYMAPEQAQGLSEPGTTTDLYSLGIVAYEMLSGDPPFLGETPFSVVLKHIKAPPPPLVKIIPQVNVQLQEVIFKALAKTAVERWQNADEMRDALEAVQLNAPIARRRSRTVSLAPPPEGPEDLLDSIDSFDSMDSYDSRDSVDRINSSNTPLNRPGSSGTLDRQRPTFEPSVQVQRPRPQTPNSGRSVRPRPVLPIRGATPQPHGGARGPAIVEDRPGHYRNVPRSGAVDPAPKASNKKLVWLALASALALAAAVFVTLKL